MSPKPVSHPASRRPARTDPDPTQTAEALAGFGGLFMPSLLSRGESPEQPIRFMGTNP